MINIARVCQTVANSTGKNSTQLAQNGDKVLKYLIELAKTPKGYRFGQAETKQLTKAFEAYKTKLDKSEVAKTLLSIGRNEQEQLNADEICKVLRASSGFTPDRQKRVFEFMKYTRENNFNNKREMMRECYPFENHYDLMNFKETDNPLPKDYVKKIYEEILQNRLLLRGNVPHPQSYVLDNNREVIYAISKCKDIPNLAKALFAFGPSKNLTTVPNELTKIIRHADGNFSIANDLSKYFTPREIKSVLNIIEEHPEIKQHLRTYSYLGESPSKYIDSTKEMVLHYIGLAGKVYIKPVPRVPYTEALFRTLPGNYGTKR